MGENRTVTLKLNIKSDDVTNKQFYPKDVFEKAILDFKELVSNNMGWGGLGNATLVMQGIGFQVVDLKICADGTAKGDIRFLDNPIGQKLMDKVLSRMAQNKVVKLAVRGSGRVDDVNGRMIVQDFNIGMLFLVDENNNEILIDR